MRAANSLYVGELPDREVWTTNLGLELPFSMPFLHRPAFARPLPSAVWHSSSCRPSEAPSKAQSSIRSICMPHHAGSQARHFRAEAIGYALDCMQAS